MPVSFFIDSTKEILKSFIQFKIYIPLKMDQKKVWTDNCKKVAKVCQETLKNLRPLLNVASKSGSLETKYLK